MILWPDLELLHLILQTLLDLHTMEMLQQQYVEMEKKLILELY